MRPVLERIERDIHGATESDRPAMLTLYGIWNALVAEQLKAPKWDALSSQFRNAASGCHIETIAAHVLLGNRIPEDWALSELITIVERYLRTRYRLGEVCLPRPLEIAILAAVANRQLGAGDVAAFKQWAERALLDAAGRKSTQETIKDSIANVKPLDIHEIVGWPHESMLRPMEGSATPKPTVSRRASSGASETPSAEDSSASP